MITTLPVVIRPVVPDDRRFVIGSWLDSYYQPLDPKRKAPELWHIPKYVAYGHLEMVIYKLLDRATTLVAVNSEDEHQLFGFICFNAPNILHYIYVKSTFRKFGIARALYEQFTAEDTPVTCTFANFNYASARKRLPLTFNPYLRG